VQTSHKRSIFGFLLTALPLAALLLAALAVIYFLSYQYNMDRQGTYHNIAIPIDLNNDGRLDVLLHNLRQENESTLWPWTTFWTNQGEGGYTVSTMEFEQVGYFSADSGDLDGDGDTDFVLLSFDLQLYLNQGGADTLFLPGGKARPAGELGTPGVVVLGDLDSDGDLDSFVGGCCGMEVDVSTNPAGFIKPVSWVWLNQLDTLDSAEPQTISLPALYGLPVRAAALGDLNADGSLDVFAAVAAPKPYLQVSTGDRVLLNEGAGNLRDSGQRLGLDDSTSVALADLDGDGDLDALVGSLQGAAVWLNSGTGVFQSGVRIASPGTQQVFLADFDSDGDADALIAGVQQATLWKNNGQAVFERTGEQMRYTPRHGLAVADFDSDGDIDVFAAAYEEDQRIWLNDGQGGLR